MELTNEDKQRIEQEADTKAHAYNSSMMNIEWQAYYKGYRTGATNATIYERAECDKIIGRATEDQADTIVMLDQKVKQLEAERSELKELLRVTSHFIPEGVGDESDYLDNVRSRILNSLKTK